MLNFDNGKIGFTPQYSATLPEQITEFLTTAIIEGRLEDGQRLVENALQKKFGVSRGPIREAFRVLDKNGLVSIIPRRGTFIRKVNQKDIKEIFPIIACMESLAASTAVSYMTLKDIEEMELALSRMAQAAKKNNIKSYIQYHLDYHSTLTKASKNDTLIRIVEPLRRRTAWWRFSYLYVQESFEYSIAVHREILDLFIKKDAERLGTLLKEHTLVALPRIIKLLESRSRE